MRTVYVAFSMGSRCALTNYHHEPAFHACAMVPNFSDEARLVVFTAEDFDRWKGLVSLALARVLALVGDWLRDRIAVEAPRPLHAH